MMRNTLLLLLLMLVAAGPTTKPTTQPTTKPTIEEREDRFAGVKMLLADDVPVKSLVDGITIRAVAGVYLPAEKGASAENVILDLTITGMKTRWGNGHRPEVVYLWNGKDRSVALMCPYGVREDGSQALRLTFGKGSLAKTIAARTTEFKADDAEFALTPETVAIIKELAKRAKVK